MDRYFSLLYEKAGLHDSAIKMAEQVNVTVDKSEDKKASTQHTSGAHHLVSCKDN